MNNLTEQQVRDIVKNEMEKNYRSGQPMIAPHAHTGNDNLRVNEKDLTHNIKFNAFATFSDGGDTLKINVVSNPSRVLFYGFARNPSSGSATKRIVINGRAELGKCFTAESFIDSTTNTVTNANLTSSNVIYASNAMSIDSSGPTYGVHASNENLTVDNNSNANVLTTIESWDNSSVTIKVVLAADWSLIGNFIII